MLSCFVHNLLAVQIYKTDHICFSYDATNWDRQSSLTRLQLDQEFLLNKNPGRVGSIRLKPLKNSFDTIKKSGIESRLKSVRIAGTDPSASELKQLVYGMQAESTFEKEPFIFLVTFTSSLNNPLYFWLIL